MYIDKDEFLNVECKVLAIRYPYFLVKANKSYLTIWQGFVYRMFQCVGGSNPKQVKKVGEMVNTKGYILTGEWINRGQGLTLIMAGFAPYNHNFNHEPIIYMKHFIQTNNPYFAFWYMITIDWDKDEYLYICKDETGKKFYESTVPPCLEE